LSQILSIDNETAVAPKSSSFERYEDNLSRITELERQKLIGSLFFPMNLQSFNSTPLNFDKELDVAVAKMTDAPRMSARLPGKTVGTSGTSDILVDPKGNEHNASQDSQNNTKTVNANYTNNQVSILGKALIGKLEITPEFYSIMVSAKNKILSLASVDVDDIVSQIKDRMKFLKDNGRIELSIALKPGNLGSIVMDISSFRGQISINIYADKQAKQAMEESMDELAKSLKNAELSVEKLSLFSEEKRRHRGA